MCTNSDLYRICVCIFNSRRICAQFLYSDLLNYFWMKDSLEILEDSLKSIIPLRSVWVIISTYHKVLMVHGPLRRGQFAGDFLMVCCSLRNFLPLGNDYLFLSHESLRIEVDSTLKGVLPNSTRKILFYNSQGSNFCALDSRGSPSMILDLLGIQLMILNNRGVFMMISGQLRDV